jgi:hypothetical protein
MTNHRMPKRSECTCGCHKPGVAMLHFVACCKPDDPPPPPPMKTYLFFRREGHFYPVEEESDEKVLKHVALNPGTLEHRAWPSNPR